MNFKEFDEMIKSGLKTISLTEDIILDEGEEEIYWDTIEINTEGMLIDGNNHTIDGKNKVSILYIEAPNVTLKNIIFKNGLSDVLAGAISNYSPNLMINHCQFIDNSTESFSELYGGAIYNAPDSKLSAVNLVFKDNGSDFGGAIYIDSGSTMDMKGCVFEANIAEFDGGAIYNKGDIIITDSIFNGNMAVYGGAIFNEKKLTVNYSIFRNNIGSGGYDIKSDNDDYVLYECECRFVNNNVK